MNTHSENTRLRYKYRNLILRGKIKVPRSTAIRLVGPDCAYHLYRQESSKRERDNTSDT
jgi:hypothetical protein